jgi:hypothetical protein
VIRPGKDTGKGTSSKFEVAHGLQKQETSLARCRNRELFDGVHLYGFHFA